MPEAKINVKVFFIQVIETYYTVKHDRNHAEYGGLNSNGPKFGIVFDVIIFPGVDQYAEDKKGGECLFIIDGLGQISEDGNHCEHHSGPPGRPEPLQHERGGHKQD